MNWSVTYSCFMWHIPPFKRAIEHTQNNITPINLDVFEDSLEQNLNQSCTIIEKNN